MLNLEGRTLLTKEKTAYQKRVSRLQNLHKHTPRLAVILVGDHPASLVYIGRKRKECEAVGIKFDLYKYDSDVSVKTVSQQIEKLNGDDSVDGILIQRPLPKQFTEKEVLLWVKPSKDVDGLHPENLGRLFLGIDCLSACTPKGILKLLHHYGLSVSGKHCVVVGRSSIVGKPLAGLLLRENASLTLLHSKSENLNTHLKSADFAFLAIGRAHFFKPVDFKKDSVVIDIGISRSPSGLLCGDLDPTGASDYLAALSPVPGGVGPLTLACLLENTLIAAERRFA